MARRSCHEADSGEKLSPQGTLVEWTVEESWFFRLSAYQDRLLAHYEAHPDFIRPESRRNEVLRFVEGGLTDLSISRASFDWGVKVPGSPDHVMYVWLDALTNYLTGVGYPDDTEAYRKFWPADLHIIGKDVVRFHAVYWPAFLMSAGIPLPKQVFGHGFLLHRGEKMSKSLGNVVDPHDLIRAFGVDQLRYFLLREVTFGQDGGYTSEAIVTKVNADLANSFGNLAQRTLSFIAKNCEGVVPRGGKGDPADAALLALVRETVRRDVPGHFEALALVPRHRGLAARRLRLQPIYRRAGALGAAQDRPRADDRRPRHALRSDHRPRHRHPADHPGLGRQAARRDGRAGGRADLCGARGRGPLRAARRVRLHPRRAVADLPAAGSAGGGLSLGAGLSPCKALDRHPGMTR